MFTQASFYKGFSSLLFNSLVSINRIEPNKAYLNIQNLLKLGVVCHDFKEMALKYIVNNKESIELPNLLNFLVNHTEQNNE